MSIPTLIQIGSAVTALTTNIKTYKHPHKLSILLLVGSMDALASGKPAASLAYYLVELLKYLLPLEEVISRVYLI